jgi:DNA-binding NarL/FixJ family response regulator
VRHPQLLVCEFDGRLAALLRGLAAENAWSLREPRQNDACLRLLERGGPAVVVIRAGRDLEQELALVEQVRSAQPDVGVVVVGDADHVRLVGLAWDLGASWVHLPPQSSAELVEVVAGLMGTGPKEGA